MEKQELNIVLVILALVIIYFVFEIDKKLDKVINDNGNKNGYLNDIYFFVYYNMPNHNTQTINGDNGIIGHNNKAKY